MQEGDFVRRIQSLGESSDTRKILALDYGLIAILISLCSVGVLVIFSATGQDSFFVKRQASFIVIGFCLMCAMAQVPPRVWERWAPVLFAIGIFVIVDSGSSISTAAIIYIFIRLIYFYK